MKEDRSLSRCFGRSGFYRNPISSHWQVSHQPRRAAVEKRRSHRRLFGRATPCKAIYRATILVKLLETFSDQAVIAIENIRLFEAEQQRTRELTESLQQQTATADVLKVISRSTFELQTVLDTLLKSAARLCEARRGVMFRRDGDSYRAVAFYNASPEIIEFVNRHPIKPGRHTITARVALERRTIHVADLQADPEYNYVRRDIDPIRTELGVPMFRENELVGVIILYKLVVQPFTDKQIELVTTFADQAVIAIENMRLFEAEQQRSRELAESLEQQTATSEVLQVISRSAFDLEAVLNTLVESASRVCEADRGVILRPTGEGASYHSAASYGHTPEYDEYIKTLTFTPGRGTVSGRVLLAGKSVQIADVLADAEWAHAHPGAARLGNFRTMLGVPLLREGTPIGIFLLQRAEVRPFTEKQIKLVETFADQAVIAIENTRLFEAEQQRARELSESLEQQTATSEVLHVISSSPGELEPVFDSILANATRLCEATHANVWRFDGQQLHIAAVRGNLAFVEWLRRHSPVPPIAGSAADRIVRGERIVHVTDRREEEAYRINETFRELVNTSGVRASLSVALRKDEMLLGMINVYRQEVRPFSDKQITLLENFAAQAVIAIENARLLNELRQRTVDLSESLQQQTATADVLRVISRSTFDLQTVLDTLVKSAAQLCAADKGAIQMRDGDVYRIRASYGYAREAVDYALTNPLKVDRASLTGRVALDGKAVHIHDVPADPEYSAGYERAVGFKTALGVPLLRQGTTIGVFALTRDEVSPFSEKQIELVTTFADQAVIAIENARLLGELQRS